MSDHRIRRAQSLATDGRRAAWKFHSAVTQPAMELVVFFCSSEYDLDALAAELRRLFAGTQLIGCTTAGEIGPEGCRTHSLTGASFAAGSCVAVSALLTDLRQFDIAEGHILAQSLTQQIESRVAQAIPENCFAMLLIDGLSTCEESVSHTLQQALGKIVLCGGSAGDDQKFSKPYVYYNGDFHSHGAVLLLVHTTLPFRVFKTQHFVSTEERMVVTVADPSKRIVMEINGRPASEEYARLLGMDVDSLGGIHFAASPVVVRIAGTDFVRAIQKANQDRSLTFFCAIDKGVVLRVAHGVDLAKNLEQTFRMIESQIGVPQRILGFNCVLRDLEVARYRLNDQVDTIFRCNNTVGFNTYGEQFRGMHVNQTLTGIAIGDAAETGKESDDA